LVKIDADFAEKQPKVQGVFFMDYAVVAAAELSKGALNLANEVSMCVAKEQM